MSVATALDHATREEAVAMLKKRLRSEDLRAVLKKETGQRGRRKPVEWIVAEAERSGGGRLRSRLPDDELAEFLVDLQGLDLLSMPELRLRLGLHASPDELERLHDYPSQCIGRGGRASKASAIARRPWHAGKAWAAHFVRTLGFPGVFSGLAGTPAEAESLDVEPFRPLPALEDFQEDLKRQLLDVLNGGTGANRAILSLPTGAGKTRTAVEALLEWRQTTRQRTTVLWIAQSDELCEQAVQAFREVWIDQGHRPAASREVLAVHRLWGGGRSVPLSSDVVVASIQKLHAILRGEDEIGRTSDERYRALEILSQQIAVILVDEAHRILAPTYADALKFLGINLSRGGGSSLPIIGLSATPYRSVQSETSRLAKRFHQRLLVASSLGEDAVGELRDRHVLSQPLHQVVHHGGPVHNLEDDPRFVEYFERFSDFHPDLLRGLGQERARNQVLLEMLIRLPATIPTLFFGCSVEHAKAMAVLLRRKSRAAAAVTSETRSSTRRFLIEQFRSGQLSVLTNYGVLTTGFDAPRVGAVVIGRPTASPVLYEQMIGRGMRGPRFGGTETCLVIDVEDNIHFRGQMAFQRYARYWETGTNQRHRVSPTE